MVDAAERYLAHMGITDGRTVAAYERDLRRRIQKAINAIDEKDKAQEQFNSVLASDASVTFGPTLDEFAKRFDDDMYTEKELVEMYIDEYGNVPKPDPLPGGTTILQKRNALNWLQLRLAISPSSDQPVGLWIDQSIAKEVRKFGVLTLGNFIDWINLTGKLWFNKIPNLGKRRATRLMVFFLQNEKHFQQTLSSRVRFALDQRYALDEPTSNELVIYGSTLQERKSQALATLPESRAHGAQVYGIVPIESLAWPVPLLGHDGIFRSNVPNTLGAVDDRDAVQKWFLTLKEGSPATIDSYKRAVERLVLWSVIERRCSLSSLTTIDLAAFRDFIRNPPAHWCSKFPAMKYSADWRPFRGKLSDVSVQANMSAIGAMFAALFASGYLIANAAATVRSGKKTMITMDVNRRFADEDLLVLQDTFATMPDSMQKRRLLAIVLLLQTSGLRRSEVAHLTWGKIKPTKEDNKITNTWAATFIGKGNKERIVPIQQSTIEVLQAHYADRMALIEADALSCRDLSKDDTPVLSILDEQLTNRLIERQDDPHTLKTDNPCDAQRSRNITGALSGATIYAILKTFFRAASNHLDIVGRVDGQANFLKASTHWLRHTFAHQALSGESPDLNSVQQILGHASIATTGIYTKADIKERVKTVNKVVAFNVMKKIPRS